jgi:hypothetical protein
VSSLGSVACLHVHLRAAVQFLLEPLVGARVHHLALHVRGRRRPDESSWQGEEFVREQSVYSLTERLAKTKRTRR